MSNLEQQNSITPMPENRGISRRELLFGIGGALVGTIMTGVGVQLGLKATKPRSHEPSEALATSNQVTEQTSTTITTEPASTEVAPVAEVKTEYSLEELVDYARSTVWTEPNPLEFFKTFGQITEAPSLQDSKAALAASILKMTGSPITFNIDPSTGKELADTRIDLRTSNYQELLGSFYNRLGMLPKGISSLPTGFNLIEDYLPAKTADGVATVNTNIGGTLTTLNEQYILSIDAPAAGSTDYLMHELAHAAQSRDPGYSNNGNYQHLRQQGLKEFGSIEDMLVRLKKLQPTMTIPDFELATRLIRSYDAPNDSKVEDAAYNITAIMEIGFLPESSDPLLAHLRSKQLAAVADMSRVSHCDVAATIAYTKRFMGTLHPATLVAIADGGVTANISDHESGILSSTGMDSYLTNPGPGSYFVNVGTSEKPEIIVLNKITQPKNVDIEEGPAEPKFRIYLRFDKKDSNIDLTATTTAPMQPRGGAISDSMNYDIPNFLNIFASGINTGDHLYDAWDSPGPTNSEGKPKFGGSTFYNVTISGRNLAKYIDRSRIIGRINDENQFEKVN